MNTRLLFGLLWLTPTLCFGALSTTTSYFLNVEALTNVTARSAVRGLTGVLTNSLDAGVVTATKAFQSHQGTLTHAGTVTLDFDATTTVNALSLTGNVTFATSNLATNRTYRVKITGVATNATPTFPAWKFLGGAPTVITATKTGMLSLESWGSADADVVATYAETQ